MALTGIEIFKYLPKSNCTECGIATCLAFAMNVAAGKMSMAACPYVSEQVKEQLAEATAPPVRLITFGAEQQALKMGNESVLFRHEKRFENQAAVGLLLSSTDEPSINENKIKSYVHLQYERVGNCLKADFLYVEDSDETNPQAFTGLAQKAADMAPVMLCTGSPANARQALQLISHKKPLIGAADLKNIEEFAALAKEYACPLALVALDLQQAEQLSRRAQALGVKDLLFSIGASKISQALKMAMEIRYQAIADKNKDLGFPTILYPCAFSDSLAEESLYATVLMAKYASALVLSRLEGETLYPLLTARQNIYADPQRPLTMPSGVYAIGNADENSPLVLSCNFSLTYFIVSGEIDNSAVPAHFIIKDTEGLSVLTAWAAGKFSAESIAAFIKKSNIEQIVKHRRLIIPGYISIESGALEEELPQWQIIVGPQNAAELPTFLKKWPHI